MPFKPDLKQLRTKKHCFTKVAATALQKLWDWMGGSRVWQADHRAGAGLLVVMMGSWFMLRDMGEDKIRANVTVRTNLWSDSVIKVDATLQRPSLFSGNARAVVSGDGITTNCRGYDTAPTITTTHDGFATTIDVGAIQAGCMAAFELEIVNPSLNDARPLSNNPILAEFAATIPSYVEWNERTTLQEIQSICWKATAKQKDVPLLSIKHGDLTRFAGDAKRLVSYYSRLSKQSQAYLGDEPCTMFLAPEQFFGPGNVLSIEPNKSFFLGPIIFWPQEVGDFSYVFYVRNNYTHLERITITGRGTTGQLKVYPGMKSRTRKEALVDFETTLPSESAHVNGDIESALMHFTEIPRNKSISAQFDTLNVYSVDVRSEDLQPDTENSIDRISAGEFSVTIANTGELPIDLIAVDVDGIGCSHGGVNILDSFCFDDYTRTLNPDEMFSIGFTFSTDCSLYVTRNRIRVGTKAGTFYIGIEMSMSDAAIHACEARSVRAPLATMVKLCVIGLVCLILYEFFGMRRKSDVSHVKSPVASSRGHLNKEILTRSGSRQSSTEGTFACVHKQKEPISHSAFLTMHRDEFHHFQDVIERFANVETSNGKNSETAENHVSDSASESEVEVEVEHIIEPKSESPAESKIDSEQRRQPDPQPERRPEVIEEVRPQAKAKVSRDAFRGNGTSFSRSAHMMILERKHRNQDTHESSKGYVADTTQRVPPQRVESHDWSSIERMLDEARLDSNAAKTNPQLNAAKTNPQLGTNLPHKHRRKETVHDSAIFGLGS